MDAQALLLSLLPSAGGDSCLAPERCLKSLWLQGRQQGNQEGTKATLAIRNQGEWPEGSNSAVPWECDR